ncbi:MAG TPA: phenylalanine--tRNA ligase subunit alpha [Gemmatales bacterium]|nr:phenylalanine--tRNA ligase subunit alpha [Gemmatales bacterium]HMP15500.1 phenylalanine--tRNA ligase subunit alpha [Gemmatales bacterium]
MTPTELQTQALTELAGCSEEPALKAWSSKYLGKAGLLTEALKKLGTLPAAERPAFGQAVNQVKQVLLAAEQAKAAELAEAELQKNLTSDVLDVTLPGRPVVQGRLHPATQTMRRILSIFADMGFLVFHSREVETDQNNFELLNMPEEHPARDMWDTFFTKTPGVILRTHTSPGQIHAMRKFCPQPVRVVLPGMCYRFEQISARSEIQFQQVEGLAIGSNITMADLKGTIQSFVRRLFGQEREIRMRSSYFPFTEPSIEVDVSWPVVDEASDRLTKGTGWLEIMGAGMIHPRVLANGGYDPERHTGFAFGLGPQRIAMLLHGINDIRYFWGNELAFLEQF